VHTLAPVTGLCDIFPSEVLSEFTNREGITVKWHSVIWGAIVVLAGSIMVSASVIAGAISRSNYAGGNESFVGAGLIVLGLFGPVLERVCIWFATPPGSKTETLVE
jgi:hypothetical protein